MGVLDHHLGGIMLGLDRVGGVLEAIAALEPKKIKSDKFQYPKSLSDPDWDDSERLREMDEVEADYAGLGKFYRGNIARDHGDDTYDIVYYRYDDGGRVRETRVAGRLIRLVYRWR